MIKGNCDADDGLRWFLSSTLRDGFVPWLIENDYDTLEPEEPNDFQLFLEEGLYTLQGNLSNITVEGLSTAYFYETSGSFDSRSILVRYAFLGVIDGNFC